MITKLFNKWRNRHQIRKFEVPRRWSNSELKKYSHLFTGSVINVSAERDSDKCNGVYRDYFVKANEYYMSNVPHSINVAGGDHSLCIDLEADLSETVLHRFDVVFCHTTLEHIYECRKAFRNLCEMSRDVVIVVVPFMQQLHGSAYSDYWRFSPHAMFYFYFENNLKLRYCSSNGGDRASIYLFCIGYRNNRWDALIPERFDVKIDSEKRLYADGYRNVIGGRVV